MSVEDSGGSCDYYEILIEFPIKEGRPGYIAECGDIIEHLEMTPNEANIFKEVWRGAAARQGRRKKGNNALRGAEKIYFFAKRILTIAKRNK